MQGKSIGHGHSDYYSLILHGKGRLLYPDLNVTQYESTYVGWTREGIAHNTLLVDHQSPSPGPFTTKHDFRDAVKYFAIGGSAYRGRAADPRAADGQGVPGRFLPRGRHGRSPAAADVRLGAARTGPAVPGQSGRLSPGPRSGAFLLVGRQRAEPGRPTPRSAPTGSSARPASCPGSKPFGKEWFSQEVGVRMTMLGAPGTRVYAGDGPMCDGPPYHRLDGNPEGTRPLVLVRREGPGHDLCRRPRAVRRPAAASSRCGGWRKPAEPWPSRSARRSSPTT